MSARRGLGPEHGDVARLDFGQGVDGGEEVLAPRGGETLEER
jgi:hypothetical protein